MVPGIRPICVLLTGALLAGCAMSSRPRANFYPGYELTAVGSVYTNENLTRTRYYNDDPYYKALHDAETSLRNQILDGYLTDTLQVADLAKRDKRFSDFVIAYSQRFREVRHGETGIGSYQVIVAVELTPSFFRECEAAIKRIAAVEGPSPTAPPTPADQ